MTTYAMPAAIPRLAPVTPASRMELVTVDPAYAAELLSANENNRRVTKSLVQQYATTMRLGLWRNPTAEALAVDSDGNLIQGQHRLMALIDAGVTLQFWINFNADPEDYHVLDRGKKRSLGDVVSMEGVPSANNAVAVARAALKYGTNPALSWNSPAMNALVTPDAVLEFTLNNRELVNHCVRTARNTYAEIKIPMTQYGGLMLHVARISPSLDDWYAWDRQVATGENLSAGMPAFAYRRWAINLRTTQGGSATQYLAASSVKAWNAYVSGRQLSQLKWRSDESMPIALPARAVQS